MITTCHCVVVAVCINLLLAWSAPASAEGAVVGTAACAPLTKLERRIVDKADHGMPALRRFVSMTRFIYGVDMIDVADSLDKWRANMSCATTVAAVQQQE